MKDFMHALRQEWLKGWKGWLVELMIIKLYTFSYTFIVQIDVKHFVFEDNSCCNCMFNYFSHRYFVHVRRLKGDAHLGLTMTAQKEMEILCRSIITDVVEFFNL